VREAARESLPIRQDRLDVRQDEFSESQGNTLRSHLLHVLLVENLLHRFEPFEAVAVVDD
jgi:hypothetical protein